MANQTPNRRGARTARGKVPAGVWVAVCAAAALIVVCVGFFAGTQFFTPEQEPESSAAAPGSSVPEEEQTIREGFSVDGAALGGMTREEARAALEELVEERRGAYEAYVAYGENTWQIRGDSLEFDSNIEEILAAAPVGEGEAATEERVSLEAEPAVESLRAAVAAIAAEIDCEVQEPTVTGFDGETGEFTLDEGADGAAVDQEQLLALLLDEGGNGATVQAPVTVSARQTSADSLRSHLGCIGAYSTVSTNTANGNHNMALALASMDGVALQPGDVFSFNGTTGDTTNGSLGYLPATAIVGGKNVQEYGGGICQASTTLYGAALRANMEIVERSNHLWPSSYCPIGQDATVSYGSLDFKFRNSSDYPVYIKAWMSGKTLYVELYGYQPDSYDEVRVSSWQTGTLPQPDDTYQVDESLAKDQVVLDRAGNAGRTASAERSFYLDGKLVKTESLPDSRYRAVATVYRVGPGTDTSQIVNGSIPSAEPSQPEPSQPEPSQPESSAPESSQPDVPAGTGAESSAPESSAPEQGGSEPGGTGGGVTPEPASSAAEGDFPLWSAG